jgi:hypothetical protein
MLAAARYPRFYGSFHTRLARFLRQVVAVTSHRIEPRTHELLGSHS